MADAAQAARRQIFAGTGRHDERRREITYKALDGNKQRLEAAIADSEELIEEAISVDPRLAHRAQWRRRDEGEHCDSALLAQGDDQPFYKHTRQIVSDNVGGGERIRVVVSTDSNDVPLKSAAAFIATIRIVQQFAPIEVWWQGAWLTEDKYRGFVFHVPLVLGDMDFSRLEYCIADDTRDSFSWTIMATHAVHNLRESCNGCDHRAEYSYLSGKDHFVSHDGISPNGNSIALHACRWLGIEDYIDLKWQQDARNECAIQRLPPEKTDQAGRPPSAEEIERNRKWEQEWQNKKRIEALQRTVAAQTVNI